MPLNLPAIRGLHFSDRQTVRSGREPAAWRLAVTKDIGAVDIVLQRLCLPSISLIIVVNGPVADAKY